MKKIYEIPVYLTMTSKVKVEAESIKEAERLIQEGLYNFDEVKSQAKFISNKVTVDSSFIDGKMREEFPVGFKFISEEEWDSMIRKSDIESYGVICDYYANYDERLISLYHGYEESKRTVDEIKDNAKNIIDEIKASTYSKYIENIDYDMPDICEVRFIDMILANSIRLDELKEFLNYLKKFDYEFLDSNLEESL